MAWQDYAALALPNWGYGAYQYYKGKKAEEGLTRPEYEIPSELGQNIEDMMGNLSETQKRVVRGLPAEVQRNYIENIQRGKLSSLSALTGRKAGLVGVGDLAQTEADQYRELMGMDAKIWAENEKRKQQDVLQARKDLVDTRMPMAEAKSLQWQINKMQPYLQALQEAKGLQAAGIQNVGTGHNEIKSIFSSIFGKQKGGGNSPGNQPLASGGSDSDVYSSQQSFSYR